MARFIVRHQHEAARCPAADPYAGAKLLNYLSRPNVRQYGIEIHGEAVVRGEHTLYMIVESEDEDRVRSCHAGGQAGSLGWARTGPAPARCRQSARLTRYSSVSGLHSARLRKQHLAPIGAGLVVYRANPLNCETSIPGGSAAW
jgi:hypothetical protein